MIVLEQDVINLEWTDLHTWKLPQGEASNRSPGIHVSSILKALALSMNLFTVDDESDEMPLRIGLGLAWEPWVIGLYPEINYQPGELKREDIIGSPDGASVQSGSYEIPNANASDPPSTVHILDNAIVIEECKYTGKSLRVKGGTEDQWKDIRSEWMWMEQVRAYCWMMSDMLDRLVHHARLHICWKYGVYGRWPPNEIYIRYLVQFTKEEVESTGKMLVDNMEMAEDYKGEE